MRAVATILCGLLLVSGGFARAGQYSGVLPDDLTRWTDAEICRAMAVAPDRAIFAEAARRDLGDCTAEHQRCRVNGYNTGTDAYRACRQYLAQMQALKEGRSLSTALPGMETVPSSGPVGSGNTMFYAFPDGQRLHCTTLRNLISCF